MYVDSPSEEVPVPPSPAEVTIVNIADLELPEKQRIRQLLVDLLSIYTNNTYKADAKLVADYLEIMPDSIAILANFPSKNDEFVAQLTKSMNASKKCHIEIIQAQGLIKFSDGMYGCKYELRSIDLEAFQQLVNEHIARYRNQRSWKHATLVPAIEVLQANFPTLSFDLVNGINHGSFDYPYWYIEGRPKNQLHMVAANIQAIQTHPAFEADGIHEIQVDFIKEDVKCVFGIVITRGTFIFTMGDVNTFVQRFRAKPVLDQVSSSSSSHSVSRSSLLSPPVKVPVIQRQNCENECSIS